MTNSILPAGYILIDGLQTPASKALIIDAMELWQCRVTGKDLKAAEDRIKTDLLEGYADLDPSAAIVIPGVCRITLKRGAVKRIIKDLGAVRSLLGARFDDLVDTKINYGVTAKLEAMLTDDADALGLTLRDHIATTVADPTVAIVAA